MESVEHMTRALQVASTAMRAARETNPPKPVMDLLEEIRVSFLRVAKREADVDIDSKAVNALSLIVQRRRDEAFAVLQDTQREWRQRGATAQATLQVLERARATVLDASAEDPAMASTTYGYFLEELRGKVVAAGEIARDYQQLAEQLRRGLTELDAAR